MAEASASVDPSPSSGKQEPKPRIAGRYELLEVVGRGGMAVVWRAIHHGPGRFQRAVAVKQIHAHLTSQKLYRDLFLEEARIGSILQDPNIAQIYDFVEAEDDVYLVMEWVNGIDLATYVRYIFTTLKKETRWELIAAIGVGVLRGLAAAHERRNETGEVDPILHRDICPHNVLISDKGRAKLIDFGLGYAHDRDIDDTDPGMAKGKLAYLAPEIVRGGKATPQSDQFAVGSMLWEALAGRRAFSAKTDLETYKLVANAEVERLRDVRPDIPKSLAALVHRSLALDPEKRFVDCRAMAQALGKIMHEHRAKEDLYDLLSHTVVEARAETGIGSRSQDPALEPSIPKRHSGLVELLVEKNDQGTGGFRKWLPAFLRKLGE